MRHYIVSVKRIDFGPLWLWRAGFGPTGGPEEVCRFGPNEDAALSRLARAVELDIQQREAGLCAIRSLMPRVEEEVAR